MPKCVVKKCRNNTRTTQKKDGVTYHRFPVNEIMREKWRRLVAKERSEEFYKPNESSVICSDHFPESDVYRTAKGFKRLKKTAVPHIEFGVDCGPSQSRKSSIEEASDGHELTCSAYCDIYCNTDEVKGLIKTETVSDIEVEEESEDDHLIKAQVQNICVSSTKISSNPSQGMNCHPVLPDFECEEVSHNLTPAEQGLLETSYLMELRKCRQKLLFKDRQVRNLRKQIKRLRKANSSLKEINKDLKKKLMRK